MKYKITKVTEGLWLGEGCIWDEKRKQVHYLDIERYRIYSYSLILGTIKEIPVGDYVGCIILKENGDLIAAVRNRLLCINPDTQSQEVIMRIEQPEYMRFNDGKCDKHGNLWIGTMAIDQTHRKAKEGGVLYCIRGKTILSRYDGFTIPNGMAWNKSGDRFYHIDTPTQKIDVYDVIEAGKLRNKRIAVKVEEKEGAPDGMCMDENGNLWVAMWGGSKVNCYHGVTGEKLKEIPLADKNVTCCVIGGEKNDRLFVTTARENSENSGKLYIVEQENAKEQVWC